MICLKRIILLKALGGLEGKNGAEGADKVKTVFSNTQLNWD